MIFCLLGHAFTGWFCVFSKRMPGSLLHPVAFKTLVLYRVVTTTRARDICFKILRELLSSAMVFWFSSLAGSFFCAKNEIVEKTRRGSWYKCKVLQRFETSTNASQFCKYFSVSDVYLLYKDNTFRIQLKSLNF
jgi:hypothetical protein